LNNYQYKYNVGRELELPPTLTLNGSISMTIYLYVKTHNKTGVKYLGKTSNKDYQKYTGSGKRWLSHLDTHGYDFSTEILRECKDHDELSHWGRYYSKLWNIVEDPQWANLIPETGGGYGKKHTNKTKKKISDLQKRQYESGQRVPWNKGKTGIYSDEANKKRSDSLKDSYKKSPRKPPTIETKKKISNSREGKGLGPKSLETRIKIGLGNKGKKRPNNGQSIKGTKWFNNGEINYRGKVCPEGFQPGRLA